MENRASKKWGFQANKVINAASKKVIRGVLESLMENLNKEDERPLVHLGHGDPSAFPSFCTASLAEDAVRDALNSTKYNCYPPSVGLSPARRAVADHLNQDLPYKLTPDDVFLTVGCTQAIEVALTVLNRPGANILLPRPGYPFYEACATYLRLEVRHYDLLPEKSWEVDLEAVEALADENSVAIAIINPGNPCGNVYSCHHLQKVAETARKIGILVIADEVYGHLSFGSTPFVPMGVFGSIVPVLTLGSISKRWIVPGWRIGWLVTTDPNGILQNSGVAESIRACLVIASDPATFIQGAIPQILGNTKKDFFSRINNLLKETAELCCDRIQDIHCITCPKQPEGSMSLMAQLDLSKLEGIADDMDFCLKVAKEESVLVLPGAAVGMKNWLRITFAVEPSVLEVGLGRIKAFCERHAKKQQDSLIINE